VSQSISAGSSVSFTAAASGNPTPTVQWYVSTNGGATVSPIAGATATTLGLTSVPGSANGNQYKATFTNSVGTATTTAATLTVNTPQVAVPNVVGSTQAAATTAIAGAGLTVGTVSNGTSNTVAVGAVISESPTAGTTVNVGSAVNLVVSTGPALTTIYSPVNGSTLLNGNVTFMWHAVPGVTAYELWVATTIPGDGNWYSYAGSALQTSVTVPTNGALLFVRFKQLINGTWHQQDYTYTEAGTTVPASITSPGPGSTLTSANPTFNWAGGAGPTEYELKIGTTGVGSADIYSLGQTTATSVAVPVPADGLPLYVQFEQLISGVWQTTNYTYTEHGATVLAAITSPAPSSTLTGTSPTFQWTAGSGPTLYELKVGTTGVGSADVYTTGSTTAKSAAVTVPGNGLTLYVRLAQLIGGTWQSVDYTYTESGAPVLAAITSPTPTTTLTSTTPTFQWTAGSGPIAYELKVGTTGVGSTSIYNSGSVTALSETVTVPATGAKIYVRLAQLIGGIWQSTDYTYTAKSAGP